VYFEIEDRLESLVGGHSFVTTLELALISALIITAIGLAILVRKMARHLLFWLNRRSQLNEWRESRGYRPNVPV